MHACPKPKISRAGNHPHPHYRIRTPSGAGFSHSPALETLAPEAS
jgi:hypothetical protein